MKHCSHFSKYQNVPENIYEHGTGAHALCMLGKKTTSRRHSVILREGVWQDVHAWDNERTQLRRRGSPSPPEFVPLAVHSKKGRRQRNPPSPCKVPIEPLPKYLAGYATERTRIYIKNKKQTTIAKQRQERLPSSESRRVGVFHVSRLLFSTD